MNGGTDPKTPDGVPAGSGGIQWNRILLGLLIVVLLVIVFQNSQSVTVKLLFLETSMPLIVVLVITALLGAAVGYLIPAVRQRHRS
jgi:uncharacterized integral membrane protein